MAGCGVKDIYGLADAPSGFYRTVAKLILGREAWGRRRRLFFARIVGRGVNWDVYSKRRRFRCYW